MRLASPGSTAAAPPYGWAGPVPGWERWTGRGRARPPRRGAARRRWAEGLGVAWLARGSASIRLRRPVYEMEALDVEGTVAASDAGGVRLDLTITGQDEVKAVGTATLLPGPPQLDPGAFFRAPLPQ